jgi:ERF superfamily
LSTATTAPNKDRMITLRESDALRAMPAMNPQALLAAAIDKGASVETLERLVALAKDMRQVSAREAFFRAKAEFQKRCPPITKSKTARITSRRTGSTYSYNYAPLDEIIAKVDPLLSELGLSKSWKQRPEKDGVSANCVLSHEMGHEEESGFITMPYGTADERMNPAQLVGSALTYARRYSLLAILGLAPEDDDDAQGSGNHKPTRDAQKERAVASPSAIGAVQHPRSDEPARERPSFTIEDAAEPDEAASLLPLPDEDRVYLISEIKKLARFIPDKDRDDAKVTYGVGKTLEVTDTSVLSDYLKWMQARAKK